MKKMQKNIFYLFLLLFVAMTFVSFSKEVQSAPMPPIIPAKNILIENFEMGTYKNWIATGDAFGLYPYLIPANILKALGNKGYEGHWMISSFVNGDQGRGTLTSPEFTLNRNYLNFLVGGGFKDVYVALLIEGQEVLKTGGNQSRNLSWVAWDISQYHGKSAQIKLVDNSIGGWGFIDADYFYLSDNPMSVSKRQSIHIKNKYLNFPVGYHVDIERVNLFMDTEKIYEIDIRLSQKPDYWVHLNCEKWIGKTIEIEVDCNPLHDGAEESVSTIDMIYQSDEAAEKVIFYTEPYRPYYHYTVARAWLTDVCGIFYYKGKWHLQYQRNPFGIDWANMHWGHAVSDDLVHWKELDNSIIPDTLGPIFAGCAVIDEQNTLGFQKDDNKTIVSFYTSAGGFSDLSKGKPHTQSMAYSTDGGFSWTKYQQNPVLNEVAINNRDPYVLWDDDYNQWVMVLYLEGNSYGFFKSQDMVHWTEISRYELINEFECPAFYKMKVEGSNEYKWIFSGVHGYYKVGDWDGTHFKALTNLNDLDWGMMSCVPHNFYNAPNGRYVQILNSGEQFGYIPFRNQMTFPRELTLRKKDNDYTIYSLPVEEIKLLHTQKSVLNTLPASTIIPTPACHIKAQFTTNSSSGTISIRVNEILFQYDTDTQLFETLKGNTVINASHVIPENGIVDFELLSDIGFMELFLNKGETVGTFFQPFNNLSSTNISVNCTNKDISMNYFKIYEMKKIWENCNSKNQ